MNDSSVEGTQRLRIDVAYDGALFHGFARQKDAYTVQGVLEDALFRLLIPSLPEQAMIEDVRTTCAGRTDAGVHALAQCIHIDVPKSWHYLADLDKLCSVLHKMVGDSITVWSVSLVDDRFDARFSAKARHYEYRISDVAKTNPLWRHNTWLLGKSLDVEAMAEGAKYLLGEHDWESFCRKRIVTLASGEEVIAPMTRRLHKVTVSRVEEGLVTIGVSGNAFCHQQVRSITGCLAFVGRGKRPPEWVKEVLLARNRQANVGIAPAHGLTLVGVDY